MINLFLVYEIIKYIFHKWTKSLTFEKYIFISFIFLANGWSLNKSWRSRVQRFYIRKCKIIVNLTIIMIFSNGINLKLQQNLSLFVRRISILFLFPFEGNVHAYKKRNWSNKNMLLVNIFLQNQHSLVKSFFIL